MMVVTFQLMKLLVDSTRLLKCFVFLTMFINSKARMTVHRYASDKRVILVGIEFPALKTVRVCSYTLSYFHTAPYSLLSAFDEETAAHSHFSIFK